MDDLSAPGDGICDWIDGGAGSKVRRWTAIDFSAQDRASRVPDWPMVVIK